MLRMTLQPVQGKNPDVLIERTVAINRANGIYLRVALLTADNKPLPYLLVQIYENPTKPKYVLNYALYPDISVYNEICSGGLGSSDFIIGALNKSHAENIKVYNVINGKEFTDVLFNNQLLLNKHICDDIDSVMRSWVKKRGSDERPS